MALLFIRVLALLAWLPLVSAVRTLGERGPPPECTDRDVNETREVAVHLRKILLPYLDEGSVGAHTFRSRTPLIFGSCLGAGTFGVVTKGHYEGAAGMPLAVKRSILGECNPSMWDPTRVRSRLSQARREVLRYMRIQAAKDEQPGQIGSSAVLTLHDSAEGCVHGQNYAVLVLDQLPSHWPFEECMTAASSGQKQACPDLRPSEVDSLWREITEGYRFLCNSGVAQSDGWIENQVIFKESDGGRHHVKLVDFDKSRWVATAKDSTMPKDELIGHCGDDLDILQRRADAAELRSRWPPSAKLKRFFQAVRRLGDVKDGEGLRAPGPQGRRIKPLPKPAIGNFWNAFAEKPREADQIYSDLLKLLDPSS